MFFDVHWRSFHRSFQAHHPPKSPGLVIHELFHGLGFGSGGWLDAFDANGKRRTIIQQLKAGLGDFPPW